MGLTYLRVLVPKTLPQTPLERLDLLLDTPGPSGPPWTPLPSPYTQTLNPRFADCLALCLFFKPDPRRMRQQGQRSWLRAFMLWTSLPLNPLDSHAPGPCLTVLDLCLFLCLTRVFWTLLVCS